MKVDILAVCGGNGSWLYPMRKHLIGNIEIRSVFHTPDNIQWKDNFGEIPYWRNSGDLMTFPDVIVGAPDCGSSSMMALTRQKEFSDPLKNDSFFTFFEEIKYMGPGIFFMENLPKARESVESMAWIKERYHLKFIIGPVTLWGNSQKGRVRMIVMGISKSFPVNHKLIWKHITKDLKEHEPKTTKELLEGLSEENLGKINGHITEPNFSEKITMYAGFKCTLEEAKNFWKNNPGQKRFLTQNRKYSSAPGVYRNLANEYPQVARKANRQFNPNGIQMSPRELARIQGIPDKFKIHWNQYDGEIKFWVNKGRTTVAKCPPYEVGIWISNALKWIYNHKKLSIK